MNYVNTHMENFLFYLKFFKKHHKICKYQGDNGYEAIHLKEN